MTAFIILRKLETEENVRMNKQDLLKAGEEYYAKLIEMLLQMQSIIRITIRTVLHREQIPVLSQPPITDRLSIRIHLI